MADDGAPAAGLNDVVLADVDAAAGAGVAGGQRLWVWRGGGCGKDGPGMGGGNKGPKASDGWRRGVFIPKYNAPAFEQLG